jgi:hypothetical protein
VDIPKLYKYNEKLDVAESGYELLTQSRKDEDTSVGGSADLKNVSVAKVETRVHMSI